MVFLLSIPGSRLLPVSPQHLQHALTSRPLMMLVPCPAFFWSLFQYDLTKKDFLNTLFKRTLHHASFPSRFSVVLTCLLSLVSWKLNICMCISVLSICCCCNMTSKKGLLFSYSPSQPQYLRMSDTKHVVSKYLGFKISQKEETYALRRHSARLVKYRAFQIQNNFTVGDRFHAL